MNRRQKISLKRTIPAATGLQMISPKAMTMFVLLAVMAILWGRVLLKGKNGPASANAQEADAIQQELINAQVRKQVQIETVELPQIAGQHDVLTRDVFRMQSGIAFGADASKTANNGGIQVGTDGDSLEMAHRVKLERIAQRLVLEAVIQDDKGRPFQAFVDDKILSVGSTLTVQEGPDQYVLTLNKINETEVLFSWNKISVMLKMAETFEF